MYIENANPATRAMRDERVAELNDGKPVVFDENSTARVKKEVGEYLADKHEEITIVGREDEADEVEADAGAVAEGGD